jgi:SAM-dependent methyltransferase
MGLQLKVFKYFHEMMDVLKYDDFTGMRLCELGDLRVRKGTINYLYHRKGYSLEEVVKCKIAKYYFESIGFDDVSIDWNGRAGALPLNLCDPIEDKNLINSFDVLFNSGTAEHVANQYEFFKNVHKLVKKGGVMIHIFPYHGSLHGEYNYDLNFLDSLTSQNNYGNIDWRITPVKYWVLPLNKKDIYLFATIKKRDNREFVSEAKFVHPLPTPNPTKYIRFLRHTYGKRI